MTDSAPPKSERYAHPSPATRRVATSIVGGALVLGLIARGVAVYYAPLNSYKPDHRDNMAWSDYAWEHGPHRIYDLQQGQWILERTRVPESTQIVDWPQRIPHACNYPPLSACVFWLQGAVWRALDRQSTTLTLPPAAANQLGVSQVTSRVIETHASRAAQATPAIVADIALAFGVAALLAAMSQKRGVDVSGAVAFAIAFLAPPVILDSSFWNQTDSWIAAWMVWAVWAVLRERFLLAGILCGAALLTKPQGILLAPVFCYAFAARGILTSDWRQSVKPAIRTLLAGAITVSAIALPFMISDWRHADGPLRWFKRSYVATIGASEYQRTTLNAFNVWWLHRMANLADDTALDAGLPIAGTGLSRAAFGKLLLLSAMAVSFALCGRCWSWGASSAVAFAAMVCLGAFVLPTSVHERYIYYCIPFLIPLAVRRPGAWALPLLGVVTVGTFEMTSFRWVRIDDSAARSLAAALAWTSIASLLLGLWALTRGEKKGAPICDEHAHNRRNRFD